MKSTSQVPFLLFVLSGSIMLLGALFFLLAESYVSGVVLAVFGFVMIGLAVVEHRKKRTG